MRLFRRMPHYHVDDDDDKNPHTILKILFKKSSVLFFMQHRRSLTVKVQSAEGAAKLVTTFYALRKTHRNDGRNRKQTKRVNPMFAR